MPRHTPDPTDLKLYGWAATRRSIHGIGRHKPTCPTIMGAPALLGGEFLPAFLPTGERKVGTLVCTCIEPRERIGKLNSTLGRIKEDREGAHGCGIVSQSWPEVYSGVSLLVHRAWYEAPERLWMLVLDAHYVHREDSVKAKAAAMGVEVFDYWKLLPAAKGYVEGYILAAHVADEFVPRWTPSRTFVRSLTGSPMDSPLVCMED